MNQTLVLENKLALTVAGQVLRVAMDSPIKALRSE